jgi:hypothetical protein
MAISAGRIFLEPELLEEPLVLAGLVAFLKLGPYLQKKVKTLIAYKTCVRLEART